MKVSRVLTVLVLTAGAMTIATPSFATTGVSADFCDSALPGNCSIFTVQAASVSGAEIVDVSTGDCTGNGGAIPTLDIQCVYLEVDNPVIP